MSPRAAGVAVGRGVELLRAGADRRRCRELGLRVGRVDLGARGRPKAVVADAVVQGRGSERMTDSSHRVRALQPEDSGMLE